MVRWTSILLLLGLASVGCGDDDGVTPMDDAGTETDSGTPGTDAGRDAGTPVDSGTDAGVTCTTGCEIVELATGIDHVCGRRENGQVLCWGGNGAGQLGDGRERGHGDCATREDGASGYDCTATPVVVRGVTASAIATNSSFQTCAITSEGTSCWGLEDVAATGSDTRAERFQPEIVMGFSPAVALEAPFSQLCARLMNGTVVCRGENDSGQLLAEGDDPRRMAMPLTGLSDVLEFDLGVGANFGCVRTADALRCWGSNQDGQLGDGVAEHSLCGLVPETFDCSRTPVTVSTLDPAEVVQVELGSRFACALLDDGTVWCWGANAAGQLGDGTTVSKAEPQQVPGLTGVAQISLGALTACAVLDSGDVRCWGSNQEGQIGDGAEIGSHASCEIGTTVDCVTSPTAVLLEANVTSVQVGTQTVCALAEGGAVYCWGANLRRQLGQDDRMRRSTPVEVAGLD
ncbi:MAG: hypothetical protein H6724_17925 [Sandaracinus sp.]|nr:hypothetical protein [Sandaracinus sp.]MCB9621844.1 hypothetical protein [Sandaracinus sp.]